MSSECTLESMNCRGTQGRYMLLSDSLEEQDAVRYEVDEEDVETVDSFKVFNAWLNLKAMPSSGLGSLMLFGEESCTLP